MNFDVAKMLAVLDESLYGWLGVFAVIIVIMLIMNGLDLFTREKK